MLSAQIQSMGQAILDMEIEDQVADAITSGDFCFNHIIGLPNKKLYKTNHP
jgi:hypothetical protein